MIATSTIYTKNIIREKREQIQDFLAHLLDGVCPYLLYIKTNLNSINYEAVPAAHAEHTDIPISAYWPEVHILVHTVDPEFEKKPAGHGFALTIPLEGHKDPAGQISHTPQEVTAVA